MGRGTRKGNEGVNMTKLHYYANVIMKPIILY
jgi:hypothetical protein